MGVFEEELYMCFISDCMYMYTRSCGIAELRVLYVPLCLNQRVRLVERGSPHSLPLMESGKVRALPLAHSLCSVCLSASGGVNTNCVSWADPARSEGHHSKHRDQRPTGRLTPWGGTYLLAC